MHCAQSTNWIAHVYASDEQVLCDPGEATTEHITEAKKRQQVRWRPKACHSRHVSNQVVGVKSECEEHHWQEDIKEYADRNLTCREYLLHAVEHGCWIKGKSPLCGHDKAEHSDRRDGRKRKTKTSEKCSRNDKEGQRNVPGKESEMQLCREHGPVKLNRVVEQDGEQ
jgi:hypothetical protein